MRNAAGTPKGGIKWKPIPEIAGGYTAQIDIANDGTVFCCTDVHGAFIKGPTETKFRQVFNAASLPAGQFGASRPINTGLVTASEGAWCAALAQSNGAVAYACYNAFWWRSTNRGASWVKIGGPWKMFSDTGSMRLWGFKCVVDPQNPDVAMLGVEDDKVIVTTNGTSATPTATVVTTATSTLISIGGINYKPPTLVAVDPSSTVTGGIKQKWAYSVYGVGIYESTTGPTGTYSLLTGSPTSCGHLMYDASGNLWALNYTESVGGNLYKKTPAGTFTKMTGGGIKSLQFDAMTVNPADTSKVYIFLEGGGQPQVSNDGGVTWSDMPSTAYPAPYGLSYFQTAIRWMGVRRGHTNPISVAKFAPVASPYAGRLYAGRGLGMSYIDNVPTSLREWIWIDDSEGLVSIETHCIIVPPTATPKAIHVQHDFGYMRLDDEDKANNLVKIPTNQTQNTAWYLDWAPEDPNFMVMCCGFLQGQAHGYTTDGLNTVQRFASDHPQGATYGGLILACSKDVLVWFPSDNARPAETINRGVTWNYINYPGQPTTAGLGWHLSHWYRHFFAAVDKTNGDLYACNYPDNGNAGFAGIHKRTFSTGAWSKILSGNPGGVSSTFGFFQLKHIPGNTGHFAWKGSNNTALFKSTNGCVTWTAVPNTTSVKAIGFGKAAPGKTYPTAFMIGTVSSVFGIYRSDDFDQATPTWTFLDTYAGNDLGSQFWIEGHPTIYGKCYVGCEHNGGWIGTYDKSFTAT